LDQKLDESGGWTGARIDSGKSEGLVTIRLIMPPHKVVLYSELYEPLVKKQDPPKNAAGYVVFDKATNKEVAFTGAIPLDEFIQKGNTAVPFTLILRVSDWPPGACRLVLQAVDGANNRAPQKEIEFTLSD
jgi:hypothetical protein